MCIMLNVDRNTRVVLGSIMDDLMTIISQRLTRIRPVDRIEFILERCRNLRVLHLGCTDSPYTNIKFGTAGFLQTRICEVASRCVGIDIDKPAITWLKSQGLDNLHYCDVADVGDLLNTLSFVPEIVIAGEILEHIDNPGLFLKNLTTWMLPDTSLLLTVPNAFYIRNFFHTFLSREKTHPNHVAFYSHITINRLLMNSEFETDLVIPYFDHESNKKYRVKALIDKLFFWISPYFSNGLIAVAHPSVTRKSETEID